MRRILNNGAPWLWLLALVGNPALPEPPTGVAVERALLLMGTELHLAVEATDRPAALRASEAAVRALEATEARLSTWRPDSELARLNRAPVGAPIPLSPALATDLEAARRCSEATAGAFDPTLGALVEAWGLRRGGRRPTAGELEQARAATGMSGLELSGHRAIRRRSGLVVEEGGFGKGTALAAAAAALLAEPGVRRASLDLGGQLVVLGDNTTWSVSVADPRDRTRAVVELRLTEGSVATSANSERGVELEGVGKSHLLDPRSGLPVADFGSLTVWTADPLRSDCLSTGLYVLGPERALAWAFEQPGVEVLVLEPRGTGLLARVTPGLGDRLSPLVSELTLRVVPSGPKTTSVQAVPASVTPATNRGRRVSNAKEPGPSALSKHAGSHPRISTRSVHAASTSNQAPARRGLLPAAGRQFGHPSSLGPE